MLNQFRENVQKAGFPGIHLNAILYGIQILPGKETIKNHNEILLKLGLDSVNSYVWVHHVLVKDFPQTEYEVAVTKAAEYWHHASTEHVVPYFPNVTMGWDSSPRARQADPYENIGYPFMATIKNNTPEALKKALESVKAFLADRKSSQRVVTINSWNEWTEWSYLEPDNRNGMNYLQALRDIFGENR